MPDPRKPGPSASHLEAAFRSRIPARPLSVSVDVCLADGITMPAARRHGLDPGEVAAADQLLAALTGRELPVATGTLMRLAGMDDREAACRVLRRLELTGQVEGFTAPGTGDGSAWRRLTPPVPAPPA